MPDPKKRKTARSTRPPPPYPRDPRNVYVAKRIPEGHLPQPDATYVGVEPTPYEQLQRDVDEYASTPFVQDTLFALMGGPANLRPRKSPGLAGLLNDLATGGNSVVTGSVAAFQPGDNIDLYPSIRGPQELENTVIHEGAHLLQRRNEGRFALPFGPIGRAVEASNVPAIDSVQSKWPDLMMSPGRASYAGTHPTEHVAEAFTKALNLVRALNGADPGVARQTIADWDAYIPGVADMVDYILNQPIYAEHTLNHPEGR